MQTQNFAKQIVRLKTGKDQNNRIRQLRKNDPLYILDPFIDSSGLLIVGGRLDRSALEDKEKHPVILPKQGQITQLIVRTCHEDVHHQGRGLTVNRIRAAGYWLLAVGCSRVVRSYISKCVLCRRWRSTLQTQKMATLPEDRVEPAEPFSYCAVDLFGPFLIKEGRKASRAVHIETTNSLRRLAVPKIHNPG